MRHFLFYSGLVFLLLNACGHSEDRPAGQEPVPLADTLDPVDETALIMRLSGGLTADPENRRQQDQNTIINYAIDSLLDIRSTRSGLYYQILRPGDGKPLEWGDRIRAHYRGYFLGGQIFDSSYRRGEPMTFYIGNMIGGWNEGLQLINTGGMIRLLIPSHLAYGEKGLVTSRGDTLVPPDKILAFEIEVLAQVED